MKLLLQDSFRDLSVYVFYTIRSDFFLLIFRLLCLVLYWSLAVYMQYVPRAARIPSIRLYHFSSSKTTQSIIHHLNHGLHASMMIILCLIISLSIYLHNSQVASAGTSPTIVT